MKKVFYCIAFALLLLCSCKSYHYNDNRSFLLTTGKEKHISEVSPLPRSIGPKRDNRFGEAFEKETHCVDLTESTIEANKRFFASAEDVPKQAYTMGIKTIMQAKKILVVVNGEAKADIVERAFFGPVTPEVPASILQMHNDVTLVGDEAALAKIVELHAEVLK